VTFFSLSYFYLRALLKIKNCVATRPIETVYCSNGVANQSHITIEWAESETWDESATLCGYVTRLTSASATTHTLERRFPFRFRGPLSEARTQTVMRQVVGASRNNNNNCRSGCADESRTNVYTQEGVLVHWLFPMAALINAACVVGASMGFCFRSFHSWVSF
jgi:hypothetical protein